MKLAIVADWLVTFGGAEHVLAEIAELYPDAPLFTTVRRTGAIGPLDARDIRVTRLQSLYRMTRNHQVLLPLMPRAIEEIDLSGFDVIVSSSHAVAKGIIPPANAVHVCYCHTPVRYAWEMEHEYIRDFRVPRLLQGTVRRELQRLRRWDMTTANRVDVFLANSVTTQKRIERIYGRESTVIPPPVADRFFSHPLNERKSDYFLAVGRFVPYKRFDLLIEAANAKGFPLWIAGDGQDASRLKAIAGPTVTFLGRVPDAELPSLYAGARALLFPQVEDAGIVLREALACGTPCIALREGGALDAVHEGISGTLFDTQTTEALVDAIQRFENGTWNRADIRNHAHIFSRDRFRTAMTDAIHRAHSSNASVAR